MQDLEDARVHDLDRRVHQPRIAIGLADRHVARADGAGGARARFDDDGLAQQRAHFRRQHAPEGFGGGSRLMRDDDAYGLLRKIIRRLDGGAGKECRQQRQVPQFHGCLP
ncbi:hypothetical protein D3C87_1415080 [compost metagenome]